MTDIMDDSNPQVPRLLDILGEDQLQHMLERFVPIVPFPLCVLDLLGNIIVSTNSQGFCEIVDLRFQIDLSRHLVKARTEAGEELSTFAAPLHIHDELNGYVVMLMEPARQEDVIVKRGLQLLAEQINEKAYSEYELENLTEELIERYNEVNLIYDITEALGAVFNPQTVCHVILEKAVEVIGVDRASVMLYHEESDRLYIDASYGIALPDKELKKIAIAPGEGVSGKVFTSGKHLLIENIEETPFPELSPSERRYKTKSFVSVPMRYKKKSFLSIPMVSSPRQSEKKVMGVINMTDKRSSDMFTSDDLRLLTAIASQAAMSLYNIRLIEEVKDAERVKREMEIARQIQMGLLPRKSPVIPGVELAGRCLPATQIGGDYYDFFLNPDNKLGVVIADVSGHNVGAALMMAVARSTLRSEVLRQRSPAKVLENTNVVLYDDLTHAELFITMFYAEYEARSRILRYSNGGHNHPILLRKGSCTFLDTEGMLIGMLESVDFEEKTIHLQSNDFVILYTDGVVEATNEIGEMFKIRRLCEILETNWQCNAHELLDTIYDQLEQYGGNAFRSDDITVVVLKIH